jgi:hypothetical protein
MRLRETARVFREALRKKSERFSKQEQDKNSKSPAQ